MELEENLAAIASSNKLSDAVFNLIEWAEAHGQLKQLIEGAYRENPGNPDLQQFAVQVMGLSTTPTSRHKFSNASVLKNPSRNEISEQFRKSDGLVVVRGLNSKALRDMTPIYREALPSETTFLYTDLDTYSEEQLGNADAYFKALAADVAAQLAIDFSFSRHWKRRLGPQQNMRNFFHDHVLTVTPGTLLWRVHHVDLLVQTDFSDNAFSFFRVLYNEGWERLIMVLCCYADPNTFIRNTKMSPFNVGVRLEFEGAA